MAETITLKSLREAVAKQLGLLIVTSIDVDADPNFTINGLADEAPDAERMRDTFLYQSGVWRRIVSYGYPSTNVVTVTRVSAITTGAAEIYSLLSPDDFNAAINEALIDLYFEDIAFVILQDGQKYYDLDSWIQKKGQITKVSWADTTNLGVDEKEDEVQGYALREGTFGPNAVSIQIHDALRDVTTWSLNVRGRRNYSPLTLDANTTTCPRALIVPCALVSVLRVIFQKYGKSMNNLYGPKMAVGEREMAKAKADWLPRLAAREYVEEEDWHGPDTNINFESPSW